MKHYYIDICLISFPIPLFFEDETHLNSISVPLGYSDAPGNGASPSFIELDISDKVYKFLICIK